MRRVIRPAASCPAHLDPTRLSGQLHIIITGPALDKISGSVYQSPYPDPEGKTASRTRDALNLFYYGKCAYCETLCKAEIEHYRPKQKITGSTQPGYYWLCYEWSNLIPSCHDCNTAGGKGTQFPVMGPRVPVPPLTATGDVDAGRCALTDPDLLAEQPYLLHPELDDARQYLKFVRDSKGSGYRIRGTDSAERGKQTIAICNLNREPLRLERHENVILAALQDIRKNFLLWAHGILPWALVPAALHITFNQLEKYARDERRTHTLLWWYIMESYDNFKSLVADEIPDARERSLVLQEVKVYKGWA